MKSLPRPVIRRATRADLEKFYRTKTIRQTLSAKVGIVNGRIIACWGLAWIDGVVFVFFDWKASALRYRVTMIKAGRALMDEAREMGIKVMWAQRDPTEPGAGKWLHCLGFKPTLKPGLYRTWLN